MSPDNTPVFTGGDYHDPPPQIAYNTNRIGLLARRTVEPLLQRAAVCCCYRKRVSGKYTLVLTNAELLKRLVLESLEHLKAASVAQ